MSYVSRCQYVKAHRLKARVLMLFAFVMSVLLFTMAVPIMACNPNSESKVDQDDVRAASTTSSSK